LHVVSGEVLDRGRVKSISGGEGEGKEDGRMGEGEGKGRKMVGR